MTAKVISGKQTAAALCERITAYVASVPVKPALAVIMVGDNPASQVYVRNKIRQTEACGMHSRHHSLPAHTPQADLEALIMDLNKDNEVDGILLQLPLPSSLDEAAALAQIDPDKDVDGLTEISAGRLVLGKPGLRPCTPTGCVILAKQALGADLSGKHTLVIGRSILVGKPAALLFLAEHCTVTLAHSRSKNLHDLCRHADIVVPAVGRAEMVKGDWLKPGACIIDVGINRVSRSGDGQNGSKLVGDADYKSCAAVAGAITPVPGGVGPMTIACLLRNTILAACDRRGWNRPDDL